MIWFIIISYIINAIIVKCCYDHFCGIRIFDIISFILSPITVILAVLMLICIPFCAVFVGLFHIYDCTDDFVYVKPTIQQQFEKDFEDLIK